MKPTEKSLFPYYKQTDISMELERHYIFPGGEEVVIVHPRFIIVSDNGHRVFDGEVSHYIPYGWIHLWWKNTPDMVDRGEGFLCQQVKEPKKKKTIRQRVDEKRAKSK